MNMEKELIAFLDSFGFLTVAERDIIVEHTNLQQFKKGTILLAQGQIAKSCYAVIKGCVREYVINDGLEKTTAFYTEGQPVNSFSSYSNQTPSNHFWICNEDCLLTIGNEPMIDEMCQRIPRLEQFIRMEVEKNTGQIQDRLSKFMTSTPEQRFMQLLEENPSLLNRVPQHQIASYLGITPESLSRIKKRIFKLASVQDVQKN